MNRKYHLPAALILLLGVLTACGGDKKSDSAAEESVETVLLDETNEVTIMPLRATDFNHELVSNGKLSARRLVELRFESTEPIANIYVKNGDRVQKGQKLAELSPFKLKNRLAVAKDALERAKLELQDVLIGQGFALADSAQVPAATMQLVRIKSGYDQALANYQLAEFEERNAILVAPFDGIVANLFAKQFNLPDNAKPFCTLIDPSSLEAAFTVLESELPLIKAGDKVEVVPFAHAEGQTEGRITEINPLVDENGMVQIKAAVAASGKLFEGMNVRVSIHRAVPKQLVVPKESVVLRSGKQVIFVLDSTRTKAIWTYVQTALENASTYTIVDGLKEGHEVITSGNINLAHEAPVVIVDKK